jgi:hypothetical protein
MIDVLVTITAFTMVLGPAFIGHFYGVKKRDHPDDARVFGPDRDPVPRRRSSPFADGPRAPRAPSNGR